MTPRKMLRCKACGRLIPVNKSECPFCGAANDNVQNVQEEQPVAGKPVEKPLPPKQPVEVKVAEPSVTEQPATEPLAKEVPAKEPLAAEPPVTVSPVPDLVHSEESVASTKSRKPIILVALIAVLVVVGIVLFLCLNGGEKEAGDDGLVTDTVGVGVVDAEPMPEPEPETIDTAAIVKAKADSIAAVGYKIIGDNQNKVYYLKRLSPIDGSRFYVFDAIEGKRSEVNFPEEMLDEIKEYAIVNGNVTFITHAYMYRELYAIIQYSIKKKTWIWELGYGDLESATFVQDKSKVEVSEVMDSEFCTDEDGNDYVRIIKRRKRTINL